MDNKNSCISILPMNRAVVLFMVLVILAGCGEKKSSSSGDKISSGTPVAGSAYDMDGIPSNPIADGEDVVVLVFMRDDCPIAQRYVPEIRRLQSEFASPDFSFYLVFPDPDTTSKKIQLFVQEYSLAIPVLHDPDHFLVDLAKASVTPEVAVFDTDRTMTYRGRIDDTYVEFGASRPAPTKRDLNDVLASLAEGHEVPPTTTDAIGCYIADLK